MIRNEHQFRVSRLAAEKLERSLAPLDADPDSPKDVHPVLREAVRAAIRSQLADIRDEMAAYDDLRAGRWGSAMSRRPSPIRMTHSSSRRSPTRRSSYAMARISAHESRRPSVPAAPRSDSMSG